MKIIREHDNNYQDEINCLFNRKAFSDEVLHSVSNILNDIKHNGNSAISHYAAQFDNVQLSPAQFRLTQNEIDNAVNSVPQKTKNFINGAIENIKTFAKQQIPHNWNFTPRHGVTLGEKFTPLKRIGAYIPGGTAPLVSTAVHTIAIAAAAGVKEIAAITPPGKNNILIPELIYAMHQSGATEIYRIGGVYGIGAMAYGTETIKKVEKIVGPGNAYVSAAKKYVYGDVAIDMVAGPSEIMIIADKNSNPRFVAADILSQAEHGSGHEQSVLVTDSEKFVELVLENIEKQKKKLSRNEMVERVYQNGLFFVIVDNLEKAIDIADEYAPEHLEIVCQNADKFANKVSVAGAIFVGEYTPEPVGDFVAGPSHVLPTGGSAKYFNGLSVNTFFRRSSTVKYTKQALEREIPMIEKFAELEGLDAHCNSALIRFNDLIRAND